MLPDDARDQQVTVAVVGLGSFGLAFVPLYQRHPDVAQVVLCDPDEQRLRLVARAFGIDELRPRLEDVLSDPTIDAVHLVTPMHLHASQSVATLDAGKHCACAVPLGLSLDELSSVVEAEARSGCRYMMMETAIYTREFLHALALCEAGELGRIQFLRGAHYSDYESWPSWKWYPPMAYATHAVAPVLRLVGSGAASVRCLGSGAMPATVQGTTAGPFPVETAILELDDGRAAEVTRSAFRMAREVQESFSVYGERASFEWQQLSSEAPVLFRTAEGDPDDSAFASQLADYARVLGISADVLGELIPAPRFPRVEVQRVQLDAVAAGLPAELRGQTGHGGAEAHLVHEFVRSILERRPSSVPASVAAHWTAVGLVAHESALRGGQPMPVPRFGGGLPD